MQTEDRSREKESKGRKRDYVGCDFENCTPERP